MSRLLVIIVLFGALSCKKKGAQNNADHPVPSVPVQVTIYPNDPLFFNVQVVGGWMYVEGGINGIVLYRKSEQEFVALERTSAYLPSDSRAKVFVMKDNFTVKDTVSGSEWRIFDGSLIKGPTTWPLRLYSNTFDGNVLKIWN